jgi:hypothetical protein
VTPPDLPLALAGPILRRLTPERLTLWLATRAPARVRIELRCGEGPMRTFTLEPGTPACRWLAAGTRLHYLLIDLPLAEALPTDRWVGYSLALQSLDPADAPWQGWSDWAPDLCYPGQSSPGFMLPTRVGALLHGSCRKPHFAGGDGLVQADRLLARCLAAADGHMDGDWADPLPAWPAMLVLSGDQIYADDVAGPMLRAIHRGLRGRAAGGAAPARAPAGGHDLR